MAQRHQGADQGRAPVVDGAHLFKQGRDIIGVALGVAKLRGVKRCVHAGQPAEGVHTQARVVGYGGQAAVKGGVARFRQGVFDKSPVRFGRLGDAQIALADQFEAQRRKHGMQFGQFSLVVRCEHDFHGFWKKLGLFPSWNIYS